MMIRLPVNYLTGWKEVEAEIVDVAPHLASHGTFALHPKIDRVRYGEWTVSNVETGLHIFTGATKKEAVAGAAQALADKTLRRLQLGYCRAIANYPQIAAEALPDATPEQG